MGCKNSKPEGDEANVEMADAGSAAPPVATKKESKKEAAAKKKEQNVSAADKPSESSASASANGLEAAVPKKIKSRLSTGIVVDDAETSKKKDKMFQAAPKDKRSKIYQALNPDNLYYESRRDKEEREKVVITARGFSGYAAEEQVSTFLRDDEGNIIEEEGDEEEEEDFDPNNLPDFGEFGEEMKALRAEREKKLQEKQDKLRADWLKKKEGEDKIRHEELDRINKQKALEARAAENNIDVAAVQSRLDSEVQTGLSRFSFRK